MPTSEWKEKLLPYESEIDLVEAQIWPTLVQCIVCKDKRAEIYKLGIEKEEIEFEHWQICKSHKKCVLRQHRLHEEGIEYDNQPALPSKEVLADIEMEDGSIERELNKHAEYRYMPREREFDIEYIPEPPAKPIIDRPSKVFPIRFIAKGACHPLHTYKYIPPQYPLPPCGHGACKTGNKCGMLGASLRSGSRADFN